MKYIRQEDVHGCGLAVLAMLTNQTYQAVRLEFAPEYVEKGMTDWAMNAYLAEHGYAVAIRYPHYAPRKIYREIWPSAPFADVHYCTVWTTNQTHHYVVMLADGTILDPATTEPRRIEDYQMIHNIAGVIRLGK